VDVVLTNLVAAVHEQLHHKVDVLIFNPPYVPTPSEEIGRLACCFCTKLVIGNTSRLVIRYVWDRARRFLVSQNKSDVCLLTYTAGSGIEASWAGGVDGREVIDVFLPYIEVKPSICAYQTIPS
jgi:methylase of polypeptide subunit release factors